MQNRPISPRLRTKLIQESQKIKEIRAIPFSSNALNELADALQISQQLIERPLVIEPLLPPLAMQTVNKLAHFRAILKKTYSEHPKRVVFLPNPAYLQTDNFFGDDEEGICRFHTWVIAATRRLSDQGIFPQLDQEKKESKKPALKIPTESKKGCSFFSCWKKTNEVDSLSNVGPATTPLPFSPAPLKKRVIQPATQLINLIPSPPPTEENKINRRTNKYFTYQT